MMYTQEVVTNEQAVVHLFFHCCFRDELATEAETTLIADRIVALKLHKGLDLKEEVRRYKAYQPHLESETEYLNYLAGLLPLQNKLALYSYCVEFCLADLSLQAGEERLLASIAAAFNISVEEKNVITTTILQRKIIEATGFFISKSKDF